MSPPRSASRRGRRIVFVSHSAAASGAELSMARVLTGEGDRDREVAAVFLEDGVVVEELRHAGVPVEVARVSGVHGYHVKQGVRAALGRVPAVGRAARELGRHLRPGDVVVANSQKAFVLICGLRLARRDLDVVWWLHDTLTPDHFSRWEIRLVVWLSRLCAHVIATSPEARDAFVAAGGAAQAVSVVQPGTDLSRYHPGPELGAEPGTGNGTGDGRTGDVVAINVARISPWKGQMTFIEALARVPGVQGWLVGGPLFGEVDYLAALHRRVEELGLGDRVRFLGHRDDVPDLMRRASIFVHVPTASEPFGSVAIEAMATGLPVIVSDSGALPRIAGPTGVVVKVADPDGLAAAIDRLARDPDARRDLGRRAHLAARAYDMDAMRGAIYRQIEGS